MDPREPTIDEREVLEFVDRTGKETVPLGPPGMWHGFGEGLGDAAMQGFARTGRAAGMLLAAPVVMAERNANLARRVRGEPESHGVTDWYFENVVEDIGTDAVDYWKPQAAHVGAAGQTLNGLASALVPLAAGGAVPLIGTVAVDTPTELLDQGAPLGAALGVGAVQTAAVAAGVRIPAAWGSTLLSRLATGAGSNLVIGEASRELSARVLDHAGEQALAEQYGGDASAAFIDVGMGLAFGALAHAQAPRRITANEQAALLTANNAHHFREGTAPGRLADSASEAAHVTAMETAVRQLLDGENVDIAAVIPDAGVGFVPRVREPMPSADFDTAVADVLQREGGYVNDPDDRGGETNFGISARAHPGVDIANLTREQAAAIYRRDYWDAIDADQLPDGLRAMAFDAAVNQGVGWTRRALAEANGDPAAFLRAREARYREIVANDPSQAKFLRGWLNRLGAFRDSNPAGQALRRRLVDDPEQLARDYAALEDSKGGTVLNTDVARELSPEYLGDRTRSADVHEAASDTIKTIYETKLAQPTPEGFDRRVLFTAGGTGAGKTTGMQAMGDSLGRPEIVYDTNMNTLSSAVEKVEQALAAGREVDILYVYRDPVEALTGGAIPRAQRQAAKFGTGRTVPLDEHAKTHQGVRGVMESLAEQYQDDPRVQITAVDNSRGKGKQEIVELASLPRVEDTTLRERLNEALEQARTGGLAEDLYRGFRSPGRSAQPAVAGDRAADGQQAPAANRASGQVEPDAGPAGETSDAFAAAADQAIRDTPDLLVADENGTLRPAAEFLADAQEAAVAAEVEARAVATAANCALGSGT